MSFYGKGANAKIQKLLCHNSFCQATNSLIGSIYGSYLRLSIHTECKLYSLLPVG